MRWHYAALGLLASAGWASPARAQSNYRLAPVGGRSQLLGGTGMTYGRDAAASFLNPATATLIDDQRLSFSVNFYTVSFVYAPRWYVPGPIDRSKFGDLRIENSTMTDLEFNALPSSLCLFFRASDVKFLVSATRDERTREARIGFCFATITGQTFNFAAEGFNEQRAAGVTRQAQSLSQSYTRFAAGPTYAMHVTNFLAVGASLHASLASHRSLLAASATTYGSSPAPITSLFYAGSRGDSFQLEGTIGATLRYGKQTVGFSLKSPSIHVYGVGGANRQSQFSGAGEQSSQLSATGSFISRSPVRFGLGTGFEAPWGNVEFDLFYHAPLASSYSAELEGRSVTTTAGVVDDQAVKLDLGERARGVVNMAAGIELFMSPRLSVLGGVSTDFSAVPAGSLRGSLFNYYPYQSNRLAGSLGIASHGPGGELLFGGEFSAGFGDRLAVNSYQLPPVVGTTGHGTYQLMLVIAGSTSLRAIKRAVEDVGDVLKDTKPKPKPPEPHPETETNVMPKGPPLRDLEPMKK